jgi:hypothetical protein
MIWLPGFLAGDGGGAASEEFVFITFSFLINVIVIPDYPGSFGSFQPADWFDPIKTTG